MDYTNYNIKKILPGIYISDQYVHNFDILMQNLNINYI